MNLNNFTIRSQEAVQKAMHLSTLNGNQAIETGHILKGILEVDENVTPFILKKLNINPETFERTVDSIIKSYPKVSGGQAYLSTTANQAIVKATASITEYKDADDTVRNSSQMNPGVYKVKHQLLKKLIPLVSNTNAASEYYLTDLVHLAIEHDATNKPINVDFVESAMGAGFSVTSALSNKSAGCGSGSCSC